MALIPILVAKDMRRRLAQPAGLLLALAIPVALGGMLALAFGGTGRDDHPVIRLLMLDLDRTPLSGVLTGSSQSAEVRKHLDVRQVEDREEGLRRLREDGMAALLVIPAGFSDALLGGGRTELELVKNPSQRIMPLVAEKGVEVTALYLSTGARVLGEDAARLKLLFEGEGWDDSAGIAALLQTAYTRVKSADDLLFPPIIEIASETAGKTTGGFDFLGWMFPGMIVMGLLFTGLTQMQDLLAEQEAGTLRRQLTAPLGAGRILLAKILGVAVIVAIAHVLLLLIGRLAFGISWGPALPLIAVSALLVLAVTGFAALLYSFVRTQRQGDAYGTMAVMIMSLAGGAFFPPEMLPPWLGGLAYFTVNHWGNEALRSLASGGAWPTLSADLVALAGIGIVGMTAGTLILRRRHVRGTV